MNLYMNDVALATFSALNTGAHPSEKTQPERFYHGFVLGLLVELRDGIWFIPTEKVAMGDMM